MTDDRRNGAPLLHVRDLVVTFDLADGRRFTAVDGLEISIHRSQMLALVGESGCGKSVSALTILRLLDTPPGQIERGTIDFNGRDLLTLPEQAMRRVRGGEIAMIFQEPTASLNPVLTIGAQIMETIRLHHRLPWRGRTRRTRALAVNALREVGMPRPDETLDAYPHELSGGMCQRAMIAIALAGNPLLLLADEPTTALDVSIQRQILDLFRRLRTRHGLALLLVTHDLGVVAETADVVAVMYAGRIVELARVDELFASPFHPYTRGLLESIPRLGSRRDRLPLVSELIASREAFTVVPGHRYGVVPWWPTHAPPRDAIPGADDRLHQMQEVQPGHWVRCWRTPYVAEHPASRPDIPFIRQDRHQADSD